MITLNVLFPSNFTLDLGPGVLGILVPQILQLQAQILATLAELQADFDTAIDELKAANTAEHDEVLAAIQALQDSLTAALANATTPEQLAAFKANMASKFAEVKEGITGTYVPPEVPPPPV